MKLRFDKSKIATPIAMTAFLASGAQVAERVHEVTAPNDEICHSSLRSLVPDAVESNEASFDIRIPDDPEQEGWTDKYQNRFHTLGVKEAIGTLTPAEAKELEELTVRRRQEDSPRTGAEVVHEFRQMQVTHELVKALRKFVDFYESTGSTERVS